MRVLVVDDNLTNLEITSARLIRWGISCAVSDYAPSALGELKAAHQPGRPYGLAILDMQIPDMDRRDLVERIRSIPEISDTSLVIRDLKQTLFRRRDMMERFAYPLATELLEYSISIGITEVLPGDDPQQLVRRAEEALAVAQSLGRAHFVAKELIGHVK